MPCTAPCLIPLTVPVGAAEARIDGASRLPTVLIDGVLAGPGPATEAPGALPTGAPREPPSAGFCCPADPTCCTVDPQAAAKATVRTADRTAERPRMGPLNWISSDCL